MCAHVTVVAVTGIALSILAVAHFCYYYRRALFSSVVGRLFSMNLPFLPLSRHGRKYKLPRATVRFLLDDGYTTYYSSIALVAMDTAMALWVLVLTLLSILCHSDPWFGITHAVATFATTCVLVFDLRRLRRGAH